MRHSFQRSSKGFTLLELTVAIGLSLTLAAAAMLVYTQAVRTSSHVVSRSELQNELRAAGNQITRDLEQAGTGIPLGGIPLPNASNPRVGCDSASCYLGNTNPATGLPLTLGRLYGITPADGRGPATTTATDVVTIAYMDSILDWGAHTTTTLAANGSTLTMPAGTTPALNDSEAGLAVGDVLMLQNSVGTALGVVTGFNSGSRVITFASNDPLNINQLTATSGNIASLKSGSTYPAVRVSRVVLLTYFLRQVTTPDGPVFRLMRQMGARTPVPVAESVENIQFTYDIADDSGALTANLPDAATGSPPTPQPSQIRKINLAVTVRSLRANAQRQMDRLSFSTAIGPRNLSFRDRYN